VREEKYLALTTPVRYIKYISCQKIHHCAQNVLTYISGKMVSSMVINNDIIVNPATTILLKTPD